MYICIFIFSIYLLVFHLLLFIGTHACLCACCVFVCPLRMGGDVRVCICVRIRGYIVLVTSFCPDLFGKPQHHNYLLCVEWQFVDVVCVCAFGEVCVYV